MHYSGDDGELTRFIEGHREGEDYCVHVTEGKLLGLLKWASERGEVVVDNLFICICIDEDANQAAAVTKANAEWWHDGARRKELRRLHVVYPWQPQTNRAHFCTMNFREQRWSNAEILPMNELSEIAEHLSRSSKVEVNRWLNYP